MLHSLEYWTSCWEPCCLPFRNMDRLKQLEGIVSKLENGQGGQTIPEGTNSSSQDSLLRLSIVDGLERRRSAESEQQTSQHADGKLVVKDGKTTFVTTGFWVNMTEEIAELLQESDDSADEIDDSDLSTIPSLATDQDSPIGQASANARQQGLVNCLLSVTTVLVSDTRRHKCH